MKTDTILKLAASYTYSPTAAKARNYIPKKPSIKPGIVKITDHQEKKVEIPKNKNPELPKPGVNKATNPDNADKFRRFSNDFKYGISGTGYGRRYWVSDIARNAYTID